MNVSNNTKKIWRVLACAATCAAVVTATTLGALYGTGTIGKSGGELTSATEETTSGLVVSDGVSNGIKLMSSKLTSAQLLDADISAASVDNSYTLTAEVTPSGSYNVNLVWETAFADSSSSWASGKTASDYVTVTPSSDTLSATVTCSQAFGEQIVITVYSSTNSTINATATADYYIRPSNATFGISVWDNDDDGEMLWENNIFSYYSTATDYTVDVYSSSGSYQDLTNASNGGTTMGATAKTDGSVGTISDSWNATSYVISQNTSYSCWSGYGNGSYSFTSGADFSYVDMLNKLFYYNGYNPVTGSTSLKNTYYDTFASYSTSPIATLTVTFTGVSSGLTYTANFGICFDFSSYTIVTSISLDNTSMVF